MFLASQTACLCYPSCFPSSRLFGITLGAGGKSRLQCERVCAPCKKSCTAVVGAEGQLASLPQNLLTFPRCPKPSALGWKGRVPPPQHRRGVGVFSGWPRRRGVGAAEHPNQERDGAHVEVSGVRCQRRVPGFVFPLGYLVASPYEDVSPAPGARGHPDLPGDSSQVTIFLPKIAV